MHVAIERADACASCVAEKHRPATSTFSTSRGWSEADAAKTLDQALCKAQLHLPEKI